MLALQLPSEVVGVLREFFTCEFTTINSQGQPLTWPTEPYYLQDEGLLVVTCSIAFPVKAYNARRNPRVSLFFSNPTGAKNLDNPPAVLVQGDALEVKELLEDAPWTYDMFKESVLRQPNTRNFIANPLVQKMFTFQFQRLAIYVRPSRVLVWPERDFSRMPLEVEMDHVER